MLCPTESVLRSSLAPKAESTGRLQRRGLQLVPTASGLIKTKSSFSPKYSGERFSTDTTKRRPHSIAQQHLQCPQEATVEPYRLGGSTNHSPQEVAGTKPHQGLALLTHKKCANREREFFSYKTNKKFCCVPHKTLLRRKKSINRRNTRSQSARNRRFRKGYRINGLKSQSRKELLGLLKMAEKLQYDFCLL